MTRRRHRPDPPRGRPGSDAHTLTDEAVCARLERGDTAAAEIVYERVAGVVDAVLFRLLGARDHEREDLAQQAMERVIGTLVSGRYMRGCSLTSWATLITQHLAIDTMRARTRDRKVFDRHVGTDAVELVPDGRRTAEQILETQRRAQRLVRVLSSMSSLYAETVVLHDLLGHDLAEIARLTGVTVAAAQSRLVRGRRKVLRLLAAAERRERADQER
ncbi:MAG TPA: RNA polymerase sigma factor [Polyangia bacterium]|nr:RNA polymerase sigma factor [Polyangia bacterium]